MGSIKTSQASMSFNEENIREMLNLFFLNKDQIMKGCIVEVFNKRAAEGKQWLGGGY